jgi:hypothetical protein
MDIIIPIVFPDYKITVELQKTEVDVLPWFDFDNFTVPSYKDKISNLGHAGILFINGENGTTKYYEYGRYDPPKNLGIVVKARNLPDVKIVNGHIEFSTLKQTLSFISRVSGQSGKIHGVYLEVKNKYDAMLEYAELRKSQNIQLSRRPYDLLTNSCVHFVKQTCEKAGVSTPWMIDPRPNSYIGEFRDDFPDLDYDYEKNLLEIEDLGKY